MFVLCYYHHFRYTIHIHQYMIRNGIRQATDGISRLGNKARNPKPTQITLRKREMC